MGTASTDLTTLTQVQTYLGVSGESTLLNDLIDQASAAIERYLGRKFKCQQYTEYVDPEDCPDDVITVQNPPINKNSDDLVRTTADITTYVSVYQDSGYDWDTASDAVDAGDLRVDAEVGLIDSAEEFSAGYPKSIKVTYYGGFNSIPDDLDLACQMLVAFYYNRLKNAADGMASESEAGASATYINKDIPDNVVELITTYDRTMGL